MQDTGATVPRKKSSNELQSRFKTRKLLGVGELVGDSGNIYRSKISQLLGTNESLCIRLPRGLLLWSTTVTAYLFLSGLMHLLIPSIGRYIEFDYSLPPDDTFHIRMYGTALLAFTLIFWKIIIFNDIHPELSNLLIAYATLFLMQLLVGVYHGRCCFFHAIFRLFAVIGNLIYWLLLDNRIP
ncbi:unnamed protein product [Dracunculus medinensis]|uniref:Tumor protein p53-inducible protein 11 n=1 Tax=Dracunculus medinensis TaxID=318479 RepID=A0A0N4U4X7_DRAME|nr:unnamed protein product [Dracunculus medinensis]